jgi:hypothetical protein
LSADIEDTWPMATALGQAGRDTDPMPPTDAANPEHLVVQQSEFAGDRFWAALSRLADRRGHDGHQTYLTGESERTDHYMLPCVTCGRVIATMIVEREPPTQAL